MAEKGLLNFYSLDELTPEERYQAALKNRIGEAQFLIDDLNTRMSDYPLYSDYDFSPLTTYPLGIYRGLLGFFRGENLNDMTYDAEDLRRYIQEQSRYLDRPAPSMNNLLTPKDTDDVSSLPKLRSK
jgi:hypothetical protein